VLTYNGEIYNHERLRAGLPGPWHSTGDTEVLVHLLAKQGSACLDRLVGMFAFAAWDTRERRLLLARDRLGIKPLYYQVLPDGIAFASELKALLVLGQPEIDASAVRDFLFHGYIPAPKSIYRGIAKLPAGHTLTWSAGRINIERYWNPSTTIAARSSDDTVQELDALLRDVVPAHTLSDVPVGVFLSGGIDSALTAYYLETPRTYTLGFDAGARSETDAARRAAEHLHTEHLEMTAPLADFAEALDRIPALFDEPFGDSAAWSNYLIAQFARREVTVALSGEGGDEIFCGYPRYWSSIGARSTILNRSLARFLPPLSRLGSSMQRHSYVGLPAYAAALGGLTALQIESLLASAGGNRRVRLLVVLSAVLARELESARSIAVARFEHRARRRTVDEGRSNQHGAFARGATAAAGSSPGRVHAERGSGRAGRSEAAAGQTVGPTAHGTALAGRPSGPAEIRIWSSGASLAAAASDSAARGGSAPDGSRRVAASGGDGVSQSLVPPGLGSLVHGLRLTPMTATVVNVLGLPDAPRPRHAPRILFVPVSGTYGMGEYARSLAIARAASRHWPGASIHFALSRQAPYAAEAPFPKTLLDSSPTFHSAAIIELLENWRPDVVIFDNAGRTVQLRAARRLGARIVYISSRRRQRLKAFRLSWMRLINEHWIAYPEFIAGP